MNVTEAISKLSGKYNFDKAEAENYIQDIIRARNMAPRKRRTKKRSLETVYVNRTAVSDSDEE